ncbi:glycosyltransferase family 4 protein [Halorussus sp. MSC15.2]|uniref:glycosyltransferase family 4 protein n=1 Tax=Halorussus sp. MSC15.2 TaxID=2283638 RepID=UPI0013D1CCF8|nr:glycosyltransferase family 4 protein [Halorussus sp. MSC15.2]NEU55652.1 glycosyltransferase family 4 protein [Halorussus sp. MSC15.2]
MNDRITRDEMQKVAIVHPDLMQKGGAESVAMHILEALQDNYEVYLITYTNPDISELNSFFDTTVKDVEIERIDGPSQWFNKVVQERVVMLKNVILCRHANAQSSNYDLLISTKNELGLNPPSIEYIHSPTFDTSQLPSSQQNKPGTARQIYKELCMRLSNINQSVLDTTQLLSNSEWTANVFERTYGRRPTPVYPPINTSIFESPPWENRENGFVVVGRIHPSKNLLKLINIVEKVRSRGHDVHVHFAGPPSKGQYHEVISRKHQDLPFVHLEGELSRRELISLISSHKYALHGKEFEHFGMSIAEYVAAGSIPFLPKSGGQVEIVDGKSELLYSSLSGAVEQIEAVITDKELQEEIREDLRGATEKFNKKRFEEEILEIVTAVCKG